jgi:plasmid stabilization system protein ParE
MARLTVHWTDRARRDIIDIGRFIARDSPVTARAIAGRLRRRGDSLDEQVERGRVVPELARYGVTVVRELIDAPWRLVYRVEGEHVFVLAVLDGRRDLEDILLARMLR